MRRVLFVHNGSPGRFAFLARMLTEQGWQGCLINGPEGTDLPGIPTARWEAKVEPRFRGLAAETDRAMRRGGFAAQAAEDLKARDFVPDLVIGHPAWGEMLYLKQVFPHAPQIQIGEMFFRTTGTHFGFDPEFPPRDATAGQAEHSINAVHALSYTDAARIVCPTRFQADTYPAVFQPIVDVIHEGVDTAIARPRDDIRLSLGDGTALDSSAPIVTFINRRFEPMRGFHIFMRSLPRLMAENREVRVILVGHDGPDSYGPAHASGSWKRALLEEVGGSLDLSRLHFVGSLAYDRLCALLAISSAHVHFSYPTILSWSLLDAMACGCLVVGSDTASIREVVRHDENGVLVDFFDVDGLSAALIDVCRHPDRYRPLRDAARQTVLDRYDRATVCLPAWHRLITEVAG